MVLSRDPRINLGKFITFCFQIKCMVVLLNVFMLTIISKKFPKKPYLLQFGFIMLFFCIFQTDFLVIQFIDINIHPRTFSTEIYIIPKEILLMVCFFACDLTNWECFPFLLWAFYILHIQRNWDGSLLWPSF